MHRGINMNSKFLFLITVFFFFSCDNYYAKKRNIPQESFSSKVDAVGKPSENPKGENMVARGQAKTLFPDYAPKKNNFNQFTDIYPKDGLYAHFKKQMKTDANGESSKELAQKIRQISFNDKKGVFSVKILIEEKPPALLPLVFNSVGNVGQMKFSSHNGYSLEAKCHDKLPADIDMCRSVVFSLKKDNKETIYILHRNLEASVMSASFPEKTSLRYDDLVYVKQYFSSDNGPKNVVRMDKLKINTWTVVSGISEFTLEFLSAYPTEERPEQDILYLYGSLQKISKEDNSPIIMKHKAPKKYRGFINSERLASTLQSVLIDSWDQNKGEMNVKLFHGTNELKDGVSSIKFSVKPEKIHFPK